MTKRDNKPKPVWQPPTRRMFVAIRRPWRSAYCAPGGHRPPATRAGTTPPSPAAKYTLSPATAGVPSMWIRSPGTEYCHRVWPLSASKQYSVGLEFWCIPSPRITLLPTTAGEQTS